MRFSSGHLFTLSSAAEVTELLLGDIQQLVQDRRESRDHFLVVFFTGSQGILATPLLPKLTSDLKFPKVKYAAWFRGVVGVVRLSIWPEKPETGIMSHHNLLRNGTNKTGEQPL